MNSKNGRFPTEAWKAPIASRADDMERLQARVGRLSSQLKRLRQANTALRRQARLGLRDRKSPLRTVVDTWVLELVEAA